MKDWFGLVGWAAADGLPTLSGHPSAAGQAKDRETPTRLSCFSFSGVTGGLTAPGDTLQGVIPDLKLFFLAEFRKNTG